MPISMCLTLQGPTKFPYTQQLDVIVYGDQGEGTGVVVMGSAGYRSGAQTHHELSSDSHKLTAPLLLCLLLLLCVAITCI